MRRSISVRHTVPSVRTSGGFEPQCRCSIVVTRPLRQCEYERARQHQPGSRHQCAGHAGQRLSERFPKEQLAGVAEAIVYVICDIAEKQKIDGTPDAFNPQMKTDATPGDGENPPAPRDADPAAASAVVDAGAA